MAVSRGRLRLGRVVGSSPLGGENDPEEELAETVDALCGYAAYRRYEYGLALHHSL